MARFIEYTSTEGVRCLVNLNLVNYIIDRRKMITLIMGDETIDLSLSYEAFKAWLKEVEKSSILVAGVAL